MTLKVTEGHQQWCTLVEGIPIIGLYKPCLCHEMFLLTNIATLSP